MSLKTAQQNENFDFRILSYTGKRTFDIVFSLLALLTLSFVFLFVAIAVWISSPGPIIFSHVRLGASGTQFKCLKFRTMHQDAEQILGNLLDDPQLAGEFNTMRKLRNDPRIIPVVGRFLRRSSLDEIPQFLNVLVGDMSVVGPRPITQDELAGYANHCVDYSSVRPGITGAWQVSGRSSLSFDERVKIDGEYIENMSLLNDFRIVAKTILVVILHRDAR